ncbi:MAG: hypothetical protein HDQ88_02855, partial [Clostridia bacterium]|nr:hypothetical protein [Clostridia bacterium]
MGANHYYHTLWRKIIVVVLVLVFFVNTICLSFTANAVDANLSDADIPVSATGDAETYSVFREEIIDSDNVGEMETGVDIDVVGNQTDMDDVDLGVISESDFEASLSTIVDGEAHEFYGSLVDMCNMANDSTGGTVTLFTDVSIFNQYIFCTAHDYTINLNGHTVTMDSTAAADAISISGNVTLTIEDRDVSTGEINKPVITDSLVGSLPADMSTSLSTFKTWNLQNAAWSEATKTMTYYTVEATDTPTKVRHTSDMSSMGSIVSQSGRLIHTSNNAKLVINGGYYTSKNNIILTVDEVPNASIWTYVVSISDAWFINSFRVGVLNLPVTLRDSYIVNNTCSTSLVSAAYFGTIDAENLLVANNNASSIFYQQSVLQLRNSMFTCNATTGTSGVIALISSYNYAATITDCVVSGNYGGKSGNDGTSTVSGAAAGISAKNAQSGVIIKDTKLVANYGSGNGVAFQSQWTRATPTYINLDRVEMKYNYATSRAPAVGLVSAPITMRSCVVSNNYAAVKCGAMRFEQGSVATIIDSDLSYNIGNQGVGCLYTSASDVTFVRTKINNNKTVVTNSNDGANVQVDGTSTCSLQDCEVKDNGARGAKGGGIYALAGAKLGMNNVTISGNRAGEGSGIYALAGATMTVQGKIVIDDNYINATATEDNLNIVNGTYLSQVGPLSDGSSIGVTSRTAPTATAVVLVMVGDYVEEAESMFFSDSEKYETSNDNGAIVLSLYVEVPPNVDFDGVMFQYYINLRVPLTYDPDAVMLNLLVMNKGNLPQNGKSNAADYLYLDPDTGSIKMTTRLTSMYSYRVFPLDQCTSLSAVN